jgi:hypothetical protein
VQSAGGIRKGHQTNSGFSAQRTAHRFVGNALRLKLHGPPAAFEDRARCFNMGFDQIGVKISFKDRQQRRNSSSNPLCRYVSPAPPMYNENERHYVTHPVDEMASI